MILVFIFLFIIAVLVIAGIMAPMIMVANKKRLAEMDAKIATFESTTFSTPEEKEKAKNTLRKELIAIKAKIQADKRSTSIASDKIAYL